MWNKYLFVIAESRGIQSYLATAGTLFAGVLGIMLSKITLLIVLGVMSTVIGKLLLLYALSKAASPHHHHPDYKSTFYHPQPYVKYTKDKYFIKNTPSVHSHDVIVDSSPEPYSPYHAHSPPYLDHKQKGVSYYKR